MRRLGIGSLAALALAFGAAPVAAQGFEITGEIASGTRGTPLDYAVVGIPELSEWALTDETGTFTLEIPEAGLYRFVALRRGYHLLDAALYLEPGDEPIEILADLEEELPDNPQPPGRLIGTVLDQQNGRPVRDAEVSVSPTGETAVTDRQGNFDLPYLATGAIMVEIEATGYQTRVDTLAAFPNVSVAVEFNMAPEAIELEPIVVSVRSYHLESVGFYRRRVQGLGNFWTQDDIAALQPVNLSDVFRRRPVSGVQVGTGFWGETVLTSRRGRNCEIATWLDEVPMPGFSIDTFPWEFVGGMEVFVGVQTPPRFRDSCGVLLIWSQRG